MDMEARNNSYKDEKFRFTGRFIFTALAATLVLIAFDQYTKLLAVRHLMSGPIDLIEGVFQLRYLENTGAAFGMLQGKRWLFLILAVLIMIIIGYVYVKIPVHRKYIMLRIVLVLFAAGGIGNTIDRAMNEFVVDFFYIELINFPIFNVADIYVTFSAAGLILLLLFYYKDDDLDFLSRKKNQAPELTESLPEEQDEQESL